MEEIKVIKVNKQAKEKKYIIWKCKIKKIYLIKNEKIKYNIEFIYCRQ